MAEHPIIFSTEMVKAILDGRKTQTRRIIKPQPLKYFPEGAASNNKPPHHIWWSFIYPTKHGSDTHIYTKCPYGQVGDRLWVRETLIEYEVDDIQTRAYYEANLKPAGSHWQWRRGKLPGMFMPRWAARIFLEITNIRVERVQDISEEDAKVEGCDCSWLIFKKDESKHNKRRKQIYDKYGTPVADTSTANEQSEFAYLWDSLNAKHDYDWDKNPFVWCISFKKVEK